MKFELIGEDHAEVTIINQAKENGQTVLDWRLKMKNLTEIVAYLNEEKDSLILIGLKERTDIIGVNVILLKIIKWLKLEYNRVNVRKTSSSPLNLNYEYDWCRVMKELVEEDDYFKRAFSINEEGLYYNDSLDEETKQDFRRIAFDGFNPNALD